MPGTGGFSSRAQQGKIYAMEARGEVPAGTGARMSEETQENGGFGRLPRKVGRYGKALKRKSSGSAQDFGGTGGGGGMTAGGGLS